MKKVKEVVCNKKPCVSTFLSRYEFEYNIFGQFHGLFYSNTWINTDQSDDSHLLCKQPLTEVEIFSHLVIDFFLGAHLGVHYGQTSSQQVLSPTDINAAFPATSVHCSLTVAPVDLNPWTWYLWKALISLRLRCSKPKTLLQSKSKEQRPPKMCYASPVL